MDRIPGTSPNQDELYLGSKFPDLRSMSPPRKSATENLAADRNPHILLINAKRTREQALSLGNS